jgi:hypothetical protein
LRKIALFTRLASPRILPADSRDQFASLPSEEAMVQSLRYFCSPLAFILLLLVTSATQAEDFRISTKIYRGAKDDKPKLVSQTTTLFLSGTVYDFFADGSQTAVFRKQADQPGRFILLNPEKRIRTECTTDQLAGLIGHMREWAGQQKDPMLRFAANPQFKESFDPENSKLVLASNLQTYTVATEPVSHPEAMAEYREFLHWYTQLNAMLKAGPPPEPRLRLNESLSRRRLVPVTVELTLEGEKEPLRAEHEFNWRLSRADMDQIEDVRASLASFKEVDNKEFRKASEPVAPAR